MKTSTGILVLCTAAVLWTAALNAAERTQTFTVSKGGTLVVKTNHGDVKIRAWDKDQVFVRALGRDEDELNSIVFSQEGTTVRVELDTEKHHHSSSLRYDIAVPSAFSTDLSTAGGEIALEGSFTGDQQGKTAGGDITVGNVSGKVKMTTAGGEITVANVNGDVTVSTAGGDVKVGKVSGDAHVSTSGGEITVQSVGKDLRAATSGGDLNIGDVAGKLEASTSGGEVKVRSYRGDCRLQTSGGDIDVLAGKGALKATTTGGNIDLSKIEGTVKAATSAGDVHAELLSVGDNESSLATSAGNITLVVPQNMRATIMAKVHGSFGEKGDDSAIRSDFPVTKSDSRDRAGYVSRTVELNGGGARINLETSFGTIEIRRAK